MYHILQKVWYKHILLVNTKGKFGDGRGIVYVCRLAEVLKQEQSIM